MNNTDQTPLLKGLHSGGPAGQETRGQWRTVPPSQEEKVVLACGPGWSRGREPHRVPRDHRRAEWALLGSPKGPAVGLRSQEAHSYRGSGPRPSSAPSWLCDFGPVASTQCLRLSFQTVGTVNAQPPKGTTSWTLSRTPRLWLSPHAVPGVPDKKPEIPAHTPLPVWCRGFTLWSVHQIPPHGRASKALHNQPRSLPCPHPSALPLVHSAVASPASLLFP